MVNRLGLNAPLATHLLQPAAGRLALASALAPLHRQNRSRHRPSQSSPSCLSSRPSGHSQSRHRRQRWQRLQLSHRHSLPTRHRKLRHSQHSAARPARSLSPTQPRSAHQSLRTLPVLPMLLLRARKALQPGLERLGAECQHGRLATTHSQLTRPQWCIAPRTWLSVYDRCRESTNLQRLSAASESVSPIPRR